MDDDIKRRMIELTTELRRLERAGRGGGSALESAMADAGWRASIAKTTEMLVVMDRDFRLLYVNHPQEGIGEYVGTSAFDWVAEGDRQVMRGAIDRLLETGLPQHYTLTGVGAGGAVSRYSSWVTAVVFAETVEAIAIVTTDITHTVNVEGALADTRGMLESLVASAPDHIMVVDAEHVVGFSNRDSIAGLFETPVGAKVEAQMPAAEAAAVREAIDEVFASGAPAEHEVKLDKQGARSWYSVRLNPIYATERIDRVVIILTDITDRKINEWALDHERAFLGALERINQVIVAAEDVHDMLHGFSLELCTIFACDRAWIAHPALPDADVLRIPYQAIRDTGVESSPIPDEIPMTAALRASLVRDHAMRGVRRRDPEVNPIASDEQVVGGGTVLSQMTMLVRPQVGDPWLVGIQHLRRARVLDDSVALFEAIGNRLADGLTGMLSVQNLRQSEAQLRTLVEHAPEGIGILDTERGCFVDVNHNAVKLFGRPRLQLLTMGLIDLSPERQPNGQRSKPVLEDRVAAALRGEGQSFEWSHLRDDGSEVPCEVRLVVLPSEGRRLLRASITNITARRVAEQERARLAEQLQQAQKMEAIGQLTGGVAHDFNNLLTVILGHLELIEYSSEGSDEVKETVAPALEACRRASALTQRLLAFSRKQALRPESVDLRQMVSSMESLLRRTLGETIEVETVASAGLWRCEVDPSQLESAILNLAINARDAMAEGGKLTIESGNIRIDADYANEHDEVRAGQYVLLAVTDNGVGMTPDILARVFEPFFTTKGVGRGSGLGLSMVYGFVKQTGGHVKIYSEVGEGTSVKLYLPRSAETASQVRQKMVEGREPRGDGELVLVVEDDEHVRRLTVALLDRLGYRTVQAAEGAPALELVCTNPDIALLFTDVVLPGGMNGVKLAAAATELRPELKVLYTSGYTENAIIHHGRLDPGVELLEKPFSKDGLARRLRDVLDRDLASH